MDVKKPYFQGICDGIPIALGYLSVSFGFGVLAVEKNISVLMSVLISMTNLTSAGQTAAIGIIATLGTYIEMAASQLIINIRYSLMSLSLSQKLDSSMTLPHRLVISFGITDEIFAVASAKKGTLGKKYMYGLITLPYVSWTVGTLLGAVAGTLLPKTVKTALGILLYGMFVAIVVPPAKKEKGVLFAVICACAISCIIKYTPVLSAIPSGFAIIICAVISAVLSGLLFPKQMEAEL